MVPILRSSDPEFICTVNRYPKLITLVDKRPQGIYIEWDNGWRVNKTGKDGYPRHRGTFQHIMSAVFNARKGG